MILDQDFQSRQLSGRSYFAAVTPIQSFSTLPAPPPAAVRNLLLRVVEAHYGPPGLIALTLLDDDPQIYVSDAIAGVPAAGETSQIGLIGSTQLSLMDIPMLRDEDDAPGFYVAMAGIGSQWRGAILFKSGDGGATYDPILTLTVSAIRGTAPVKLATTAAPQTWDRINTLDVEIFGTGVPLSDSEINVLNGANAVVVGQEIIQYLTATDLGNKKWRLSTLLRGRRGTEYAVATHVNNEICTWVTPTASVFVEASASEMNVERLYRAVSINTPFELAVVKRFTHTGNTLRPYTAVHIKGTRDGSNNLTITWIRRTRIGGHWADYVDVPIGEASESYEIDILNAAKTAVLRTLTSTSSSVIYTAAQQTTDFGSPPASVNIVIYQMNAMIGRGFASSATV